MSAADPTNTLRTHQHIPTYNNGTTSQPPQLNIDAEKEKLSPDILVKRCKYIPEVSKNMHPFGVHIKGIKYYCTACITDDKIYQIMMFTQNSYDYNDIFLIVNPSGDGESISSRSSLKMLPGFKNQLDSIMYISTCMHKMLGIMERSFMDISSGKCDIQHSDKDNDEYNLFVYRLFSIDEKTNQPYSLDNLSIYYKYFKRADGSLTKTLSFLEDPELTTQMNELRELTYEFDGKQQKITDYFKSLNNLRKLPECYNYAPIINSMHRDLRKNNLLYKQFYLAMVDFEITNTDCIYYKDIGAATAAAAKQDGGKRRRNKTRKIK